MRTFMKILAVGLFLLNAWSAWAGGPYNIRPPARPIGIDPQAVTVVGAPQHHVIKKGQDLLDIARLYDLGWTEIGAMYRQWDPFLPPAGANMLIPTLWIVPTGHSAQIVVNTGEMRLFYFVNQGTQVYTYPIGMGVLDFKTPTGNFFVNQKKVNPDWHIPKQCNESNLIFCYETQNPFHSIFPPRIIQSFQQKKYFCTKLEIKRD